MSKSCCRILFYILYFCCRFFNIGMRFFSEHFYLMSILFFAQTRYSKNSKTLFFTFQQCKVINFFFIQKTFNTEIYYNNTTKYFTLRFLYIEIIINTFLDIEDTYTKLLNVSLLIGINICSTRTLHHNWKINEYKAHFRLKLSLS